MKNIRALGLSIIMMAVMSNVVLASSFSGGGTIEGVTTFDNPAISALKIVEHPDVIWSTHLGFNTALSVLPKGFGSSVVGGSLGLSVGTSASNRLGAATLNDGAAPIGTASVSSMLFVFSGPTGSLTFNTIFDVNGTPFGDPTVPIVSGGLMFSSNIIAASTRALVNGDDVRTEIGSVLIYNTATKNVDVVDDVVVSLTRL